MREIYTMATKKRSTLNYVPTNQNTLICTIGRMNPPTPGHLFIVRRLLTTATSLGVDEVYVFLSSARDGKNPLICNDEQKTYILQKMIDSLKQKMMVEDPSTFGNIDRIRVVLECSEKSPVMGAYAKISEMATANESEKVHVFITLGEDRDSIKLKIDNAIIRTNYLPRPGMEDQLSDTTAKPVTDIGSMSASLVRKLVKEGNKDQFMEIYSEYLSPTDAETLYEWIDEGIKIPEKVAKSATKKEPASPSAKKTRRVATNPLIEPRIGTRSRSLFRVRSRSRSRSKSRSNSKSPK